jgi:hypothetical protein
LQAIGIGLYIQIQSNQTKCDVMIQASTEQTSTPLKAEAAALLFAVKVARLLKLQEVTFLKDNLSLAKAAATCSVSAHQVPWELREVLASFFQASAHLQASIYHVKRDLNGVAHDCAHQALETKVSEPIFRCNCSAHRSSLCPICADLHYADITGYVMHSVFCH